MHTINEVIEQIKERFIQPKPPVEPVIPDYIDSDALVVTKKGHAYQVEDLNGKQCFTVSKAADGKVYCSCDKGKEEKACVHKRAVKQEAQKLKKLRGDESTKRRICANMSMHISRLRQIVSTFERQGNTQNCTYAHYRGKLSGLKLMLRIVIES